MFFTSALYAVPPVARASLGPWWPSLGLVELDPFGLGVTFTSKRKRTGSDQLPFTDQSVDSDESNTKIW
eukprot:10405095-Heterocapsa_arctica.AAC.1